MLERNNPEKNCLAPNVNKIALEWGGEENKTQHSTRAEVIRTPDVKAIAVSKLLREGSTQ